MNNIIIIPGLLKGVVKIPASKSISHRAVICAGLSIGKSNIRNLSFSKDIEATCEAMKNLGTKIIREAEALSIEGAAGLEATDSVFDCYESGSTLRFLIPIAAAVGGKSTFIGRGKLVERPLLPYYKILEEQNIKYVNEEGRLPLTINGKLKPGEFTISGDISSQFISGLMFALPLLDGDSKITITTELESKPYVDLTIDMLERFSVKIVNHNDKEFIIEGNQRYIAKDQNVEGDYSQVAFWLVAGIMGADLWCSGMNMDSLQGDKVILDIIKQMGGKLEFDNDSIKAVPSKTKGTIIDASQCPDLVPILAVLAATSEGTTQIINAARLRIKESDRLAAIRSELVKIGADIIEQEDGLVINGKAQLLGGVCDSWNDHRIAMALAVASLKCTGPVVIQNANCVSKSYPDFWKDFIDLGGTLDEWDLGR